MNTPNTKRADELKQGDWVQLPDSDNWHIVDNEPAANIDDGSVQFNTTDANAEVHVHNLRPDTILRVAR